MTWGGAKYFQGGTARGVSFFTVGHSGVAFSRAEIPAKQDSTARGPLFTSGHSAVTFLGVGVKIPAKRDMGVKPFQWGYFRGVSAALAFFMGGGNSLGTISGYNYFGG